MPKLEFFKYNPSKADFKELEETFVARGDLITQILKDLKNQINKKSLQNYLIKGPRGIGKTNLLRIILYRMNKDLKLSSAFIPLSFAEEEYSIISLRDFFIKILEIFHNQKIDDDKIRQTYQDLSEESDDEIAIEKTIEFLKRYASINKVTFLILIDNFDLIFGDQIRQKAAANRLRDVLMNNNFMLLIGTTPTYFKDVMEYSQPLYQFFKQYDLEEFELDDMENLLIKRAKFDGQKKLAQTIPHYRRRLKALRHLTGGNPRLVMMLYQIISVSELPEVKAALNMLLDDLTPYYKHKLEKLPPQSRKIVDTLARMDRAAFPTEIAKQTRIPVNQVSSNIIRLHQEGYIEIAKQQRRKTTYYILSERLFRIWHQMRYAPNAQLRLPFLVDFISLWYSLPEIKKEFKRLETHYQKSLKSGAIHEVLTALEHSSYLADAAAEPELKFEAFDLVIRHYIELEKWDQAEKELCQRIKENLEIDNNMRVSHNYYGLGIVYAAQYFQTQSDNFIEKAFNCYQKAIERDNQNHDALFNWGNNLAALARIKNDENLFNEAFEKYQKAVKIKPDDYQTFTNWGYSLAELAKMKKDESLFKQAFEKYQKAVKIKPDDHKAFNGIGFIRAQLGNYTTALIRFEQAFTIAQKKKESLDIYINNIALICSILILLEIHNSNIGEVKNIFLKLLSYKNFIETSKWSEYLLDLVKAFLSKNNLDIYKQLEKILQDKKLDDELKLLLPITKVYEYWSKQEDAEVLDRLNPEVREVVEDILKSVEKKENTNKD